MSGIPLVLLAAGRSSRMGEPKGLVKIGDRSWLAWQLARIHAAGIQRVRIVLGFHAEPYQAELQTGVPAGLPEEFSVEYAVNPAPERGQFSSLQCGLAAELEAGTAERGVLLLPLDTPCASPETIARILAAAAALSDCEAPRAVVPRNESRGGHPVWLSKGFARKLTLLPVDGERSRLDRQLEDLGVPARGMVSCEDPLLLMNINTPVDFERVLWLLPAEAR